MRELQKKQKFRRVLYSIPSLIILSIATFFLVKGAINMVNKGWQSSERSKGLEEKAGNLVIREQELRENIARLQTEEGVKDEIKDKFSVTQEGEYVAVIVDNKRNSSSTDIDAEAWYKKLWIAIMGDE